MNNNFITTQFSRTLALVGVSCVLGFSGMQTLFAAGPSPVQLSSSGNFTILTKTGISTTGVTSVTGNIGVSPAAATSITGFALNLTAESPFSTSPIITGNVYAPGYANPTPSIMTTAIADMETAYTDGAGRVNPTATELGAGNIGGLTIVPGLYKWGTGVIIPSDVTLSGSASDVWIFQIAQNLTLSTGVKVILTGGAQAHNVFWIVAGQATLESNSAVSGIILAKTAIVLKTGSSVQGKLLAQTAVTFDTATVGSPMVNITTVPPVVVSVPVIVQPISGQVTASVLNTSTNSATIQTPVSTIYAQNVVTTTSVNNQNAYGCLPGNQFSITTGALCVNSAPSNDAGCFSGNVFSVTTGKSCGLLNSNVLQPVIAQPIRNIFNNLVEGSRSNDVKILQEFLISQNKGVNARSLARVGATAYFGSLTRAALAEFQVYAGINPALGNFGSKTRAYVSSHN